VVRKSYVTASPAEKPLPLTVGKTRSALKVAQMLVSALVVVSFVGTSVVTHVRSHASSSSKKLLLTGLPGELQLTGSVTSTPSTTPYFENAKTLW